MIENEITLIADKLGMTISQIYQINLEYQQYVAFRNTVVIINMLIFFTVWMIWVYFTARKNAWMFDNIIDVIKVGTVWILLVSVIVTIIVCAILDGIILPMKYPEYTAMLQTINQMKLFIP